MSLRILLVDDHEVVRHGLRALLQTRSEWEVCGEAATGRQALKQTVRLKPNIAILDINLPDLNGLEVARRLCQVRPETKVLVLTIDESEELVNEALKVGARGFMLKTDAGRDLVAAIEAISSDRPYFTPKVAQMVLDGYLNQAPPADVLEERRRLSSREREVAQLLAEGKSNKEVASALNISVKTAETHRAHVMHKLRLHSVSELTRYAVRHKIIEA